MTDSKSDVFSNNRIIYLHGQFNETKVYETVKKILEFEAKDPNKDILIFIDSKGGFIDSFFAIHDTIKMINSQVSTICLGKAMSSGMMLLMSGEKGKRFITPNSRILAHEVSSGTVGKLSDMTHELEEVNRLQHKINSLILEYTNIKEENLKDFLSRDNYYDAEKAKELGIIDHIVVNYNEIFSKLNV